MSLTMQRLVKLVKMYENMTDKGKAFFAYQDFLRREREA